MPRVELVVIGASAGGLDGLLTIVKELPASLPAAVVIVMHTNSIGTSYLPEILGRVSRLPVRAVTHGQKIGRGHILLAPPDFHVMVSSRSLLLSRGPRENGFRPAIDPLFRTASRAYGTRLMGIILSGALDDGTYGMQVIQEHGGMTVVQDPAEAQVRSMPLSVLSAITVDHVLSAAAIATLIVQSADGHRATASVMKKPKRPEPEPQERHTTTPQDMTERFGPPSALSCPACGGAWWEVAAPGQLRFRCHVGHQLSADSLDSAQHGAVEGALWTAVRILEEQVAMKHRMAERAKGARLAMVRRGFEAAAKNSHQQAQSIRNLLFSRKGGAPGEAVVAAARSRQRTQPARAKRPKAPARRVN